MPYVVVSPTALPSGRNIAAYAPLASVTEMRYVGGHGERAIVEPLEVTERRVQRDWKKARMILGAALRRCRVQAPESV